MSANAAPIVVVGAGQAGQQICDSLRRGGYDGALLLLGDEHSLPYQRPPLSKKFLTGTLESERLLLRPASFYEKLAVDVRLGTAVTAIDRAQHELHLADGTRLTYARLALATGTRVRPLVVGGHAVAGVHYVRSLADGERLRQALVTAQRVAIVGGGFIGLEVAAIARELGRQVLVVEALERLMARAVAPPVSNFYTGLHRRHGVDVRLHTGVSSIISNDPGYTLVTSDGDSHRVDVLVAGIGVVPNSEIAERAGLACRDGIVVDEHARTSDPDIVAAGDCTMHMNGFLGRELRLESVQNAVDQAKIAAASLLGQTVGYCQVPWFWSDQYNVKLQIAGIGMPYDAAVVRGNIADAEFSLFYFRDGQLAGADSINRPIDHMACRRLLAQHTALDPAHAGALDFDLMALARA